MAISTFIGTRGFIGLASEVTKGTPVAATAWLPLLDGESIEPDPGVVTQKMIRATRAEQSLPYVGEQKVSGKLPTLLFVDQALLLLAQAIGSDTYQTGGASTGSVSLSTNAAAGASSISLAAQTSTPIAANDYVELRAGAGASASTNLSEIHKVASVSGAGPYTVTFAAGETLVNAYTSAAATVYRIASTVVSFTHVLQPDQPNAGSYKTFTIEKNRGLDSRQYAGSVVDKVSLKANTKDAVKLDYDVWGLTDISVTPSTPVFGTSLPLSLAGYAISIAGSADTSVEDFSFDLNNGVKGFWTFNAQNMPAVLPPLMRTISGKWTNIMQTDTYRANALAGTTFAVAPTFTQGANSVAFSFPKCVIKKIGNVIKLGDLIKYDVTWDALYSESSGYDVLATIVSPTYLPFL